MATKKIGAAIALDGEKEFKRAISDINNGMKVTASQLQLVTAKYADNANSVKALTDRGIALENQIFSQKEKIEVMRKALENSTKTYGEADNRTMKWNVSLNKAEAELINMEKQLGDNSKALDKATEEMKKFGLKEDEVRDQTKGVGSVIADLAGKLGINLPSGADKAIRSLDGAKVSTLALVGAVTGLITGFAKTTVETAKAADEILTLSQTTGLTTAQIQRMNYASELLDVSTETITGSMTKMIRNMNNARMGSKQSEEAFNALRVRVKENNGELRDAETVFGEVIDKLGKMKNETERDAVAMAIFGRSARDLTPLIEAGSGALQEFGDEAERMGYVLDGDALESLGQLDDAMQRLEGQTTAFKNSIAMVMLPVLISLFEMLNKIDPKILATVAIIGSIAVVAFTVVKGIKNVTDTFKAFDFAAHKTTLIVMGVVAAIIALVAIIAVLAGKGGEVERAMGSIGNSIGQVQGTVNNARNTQLRYVDGSHASGLNYVPYDGYVAELHKGERVQRADENPYNGGSGGDTIILNVKMDEVDEVYKLVNVVKRAKQTKRAGVVMA